MRPIDLPCFYLNDDVETLSELDLDYNIDDCDIKTVTFFTIDNVSEWVEEDGGKEYSCIRSGGTSYICPMSRKEVVKKINKTDEAV